MVDRLQRIEQFLFLRKIVMFLR